MGMLETHSRRGARLGKRHSGIPKIPRVLMVNALPFSVSGAGFGLASHIRGKIAHFCLKPHSSVGQTQP